MRPVVREVSTCYPPTTTCAPAPPSRTSTVSCALETSTAGRRSLAEKFRLFARGRNEQENNSCLRRLPAAVSLIASNRATVARNETSE